MSRTDFLGNGINAFYIHKIAENEGGYNYYGYVHRRGKVLIMREEITTEEFLYAKGGYNLTNAWNNRATLDYKVISKI